MPLFYIVITLYIMAVTSAAINKTVAIVLNVVAFVAATLELLLLLGARLHG